MKHRNNISKESICNALAEAEMRPELYSALNMKMSEDPAD